MDQLAGWRRASSACRRWSRTRSTTPIPTGIGSRTCSSASVTARRSTRRASPAAERRVPAQDRRRAGGHRCRAAGRAQPSCLGRRHGAQRRHRRGLPAGARLRALSVSGLHRAGGGDRVLIPLPACARRLTAPLPAGYQAGAEAAGARARRHRAHEPRRVLPDRVGPHGVRAAAEGSSARGGERRRLDRGLLPGHHQGRPDRAQAPLRALHQRGARAARHRHRLRRQPARGGDPVPVRRSTAPITPPWSARSSPTGRAPPCARWRRRSASRPRGSMRWPRRSTPATRRRGTRPGARRQLRVAVRRARDRHGRRGGPAGPRDGDGADPGTSSGTSGRPRLKPRRYHRPTRRVLDPQPVGEGGWDPPKQAASARRIGHVGAARVGDDEALRADRGAGRRGAGSPDAARQRLARTVERGPALVRSTRSRGCR